jgi:hypothetical protein
MILNILIPSSNLVTRFTHYNYNYREVNNLSFTLQPSNNIVLIATNWVTLMDENMIMTYFIDQVV